MSGTSKEEGRGQGRSLRSLMKTASSHGGWGPPSLAFVSHSFRASPMKPNSNPCHHSPGLRHLQMLVPGGQPVSPRLALGSQQHSGPSLLSLSFWCQTPTPTQGHMPVTDPGRVKSHPERKFGLSPRASPLCLQEARI